MSCPVSVCYYGVGCHVLCLYTTVTGYVPCAVSVHCDRVGGMACVCMLWRGGCHAMCLYAMTGLVSCHVSAGDVIF